MLHGRTTLSSAYQLAVSTCLRAFHVRFLLSYSGIPFRFGTKSRTLLAFVPAYRL
jgi:hypothetical protein